MCPRRWREFGVLGGVRGLSRPALRDIGAVGKEGASGKGADLTPPQNFFAYFPSSPRGQRWWVRFVPSRTVQVLVRQRPVSDPAERQKAGVFLISIDSAEFPAITYTGVAGAAMPPLGVPPPPT